MRTDAGAEFGASGEYTVIERPNRLALTWTFDDDPSNEQMIEVEFCEQDGVTTVRFVNSNISHDERAISRSPAGSSAATTSRRRSPRDLIRRRLPERVPRVPGGA